MIYRVIHSKVKTLQKINIEANPFRNNKNAHARHRFTKLPPHNPGNFNPIFLSAKVKNENDDYECHEKLWLNFKWRFILLCFRSFSGKYGIQKKHKIILNCSGSALHKLISLREKKQNLERVLLYIECSAVLTKEIKIYHSPVHKVKTIKLNWLFIARSQRIRLKEI